MKILLTISWVAQKVIKVQSLWTGLVLVLLQHLGMQQTLAESQKTLRVSQSLSHNTGNVTTQAAWLEKIEHWVNSLTSLQGRFAEVFPSGSMQEGNVWLTRPGKLHMRYDGTSREVKVVDGWLVLRDEEGDVSYLSCTDHPLYVLLEKDFSWKKAAVRVMDVHRAHGLVKVRVSPGEESASWTGILTLIFNENPFSLKGWMIQMDEGQNISVTLTEVTTNIPVDSAHFILPSQLGR